jgi:hypothetical protein
MVCRKTHSENASAGLDGAADLSGALPDDLGEVRECRAGGVILGCGARDQILQPLTTKMATHKLRRSTT